jgi:predicted N-acetyltransferase YhbS
MVNIRSEEPSDYSSISKVNDLAFKRSNEGILVSTLRKLEVFEPELSLIALHQNQVVGHALFFPTHIRASNATYPILSLGPISILPRFQKQGFGGSLIKTGHRIAKELGHGCVAVLGHPGYYPRFGYKIASTWGLTNPWSIQNDAFMAIELVMGVLEGKSGMVVYPEAFNEA